MIYDMPACNKIATSMLMNSCSSPIESTSHLMDSLATVYGARLAVCELYNAGAEIPGVCTSFVPSYDLIGKMAGTGMPTAGILSDPRLSAITYDYRTAATTQKCTKALYKKPQSWTSFSNSKQNSLAICQAMRVEIDKGELRGALPRDMH